MSDVCLSDDVCLSVAYIMNIHGAHSYWKQGRWAGAGPQRAAYRGGDILCGRAHSLLCPRLLGGGIKQCGCLTSVCLSIAYIGPKSRTEGLGRLTLAHCTRDSGTIFKVKRSKFKVTWGGGILWWPPAQLVFNAIHRDLPTHNAYEQCTSNYYV